VYAPLPTIHFSIPYPISSLPNAHIAKEKNTIKMQDPKKAKLPAPIHWYPQPKQSHDLSQAEPRYKTPS
jgi:hypothetical protein